MSIRRPRRVAHVALGGLVVGLAACHGTPRFGVPRGGTKQAEQVNDLFSGFVIVGLVVFAIVWSLIIWSIIRYRRRRGDDADDPPKQVTGNVPLELVLTALPLTIVAVLFAFTYRTQTTEDRLSPSSDVRVDVTGFQWGWRFRYPDAGVTVSSTPNHDPEMVLPVHSRVRLRLVSTDVIHSFYVPGFLFKRDVIPRINNQVELDLVKTGRFEGLCAEFCGLNHARMGFSVRVVEPADYRAWLTRTQAAAGTGTQPSTAHQDRGNTTT